MSPFRCAPAVILSTLALLADPTGASTVDLTSGTGGSTLDLQSFNETRGVEVTILSASDLALSAMELISFSVGPSSGATLGARVYDGASHALVASATISVPVGNDQRASIPIWATLASGHQYRICFFLSADNTGSCTLFDPGAPGPAGLPYTDDTGRVRIDGIWEILSDAFPTQVSSGLPLMSLELAPGCIDPTVGPPGSYSGEEFNETRGMDVEVQGPTDLDLVSMTLHGLSIVPSTALVGARVYDSDTQARIAFADVTVSSGANQTVTLPVAAVLAVGKVYRVCFYVGSGGIGGASVMFDPAPPGVGGFPYTEETGSLSVLQAYSTFADAFPVHDNYFEPHITLCLQTGLAAVSPHDESHGGFTVYPNPSHGRTSFTLELPAQDRIGLTIFDVQGREVWRAGARAYAPGRWSLDWNGTHASGAPAPAGIYLARVTVGSRVYLRRLALMR